MREVEWMEDSYLESSQNFWEFCHLHMRLCKHKENNFLKPVRKSKILFSSNYQWNNQSMSSVAVAL